MASYSSCFLKCGDRFRVKTKQSLNTLDSLPLGTYTVGFDECSRQFHLEPIESFEIKGKLYGDTAQNADRILNTFQRREKDTGVLLTGEKGSGKTMLAKLISIKAAKEAQIPTIVINQDWHGEAFNGFMQLIEQPVVVIFDEFEKVYSTRENTQESLLTLLDGVYPSRKLYIFTCNNKWRVDSNMRNRPGRIFYMLDYQGVGNQFIREYCQDNLENKEHIDMVCHSARVFRSFNFDMLQALVEEMNRYGETPAQALKFLNASPDSDVAQKHHVRLYIKGKKVTLLRHCNKWTGNPVKDPITVTFGKNHEQAIFTSDHLQQVHEKTGAYVFVNKKKSQKMFLLPMKTSFSVDFSSLQKGKIPKNKGKEGKENKGGDEPTEEMSVSSDASLSSAEDGVGSNNVSDWMCGLGEEEDEEVEEQDTEE